MIYPLAYLALTSALTVVLLAVGIAGRAELAAELAVVQGALLATFYAFSASTRSLILQGHGDLTPQRLLAKRLVTLPLVCAASYLLCVGAAGVSATVALLVIARRACEWFAEVRLCELEVGAQRRAAALAFTAHVVLTVGVGALLAFVPGATLPALALFAVAPVLITPPRLRTAELRPSALRLTLLKVSPFIGSTAIDGISAYVVRLLVYLVAGAQMAGHLFTAFVLGSFVASLFANVFGPTFAATRALGSGARTRTLVGGTMLGMGAVGLAIAGASAAAGLPDWFGRPGYFWLALGLSLLGGAVMIVAQVIRLRLFDQRRAEALFGPDVLRNITAIIAAPALYYLVTPAAMASIYLLTALLTLFVYASAARSAAPQPAADPPRMLSGALAAAIVLPVFFMLSGGLYHRPQGPLLDPVGVMNVPLPLSLPVCFAGLVLLARYRDATLTLATLFFLFVAMVLTSVVAAEGRIGEEQRKFVLLFQVLVPAFALVLGQMLGASERGLRIVAWSFCAVLLALVPLQLARSIGYDENQLRHDVWLFSIYQHRLYVPAVVVAAFLVSLHVLWDERGARWPHLVLAPLVAYYAASSGSTLAMLLAAGGATLLATVRWHQVAARLCALLVIATLIGHGYLNRDPAPELSHPGHYWGLFARGITESAPAMLFGHPRVMDRSVALSAHNYYLDFVYNFGVLGFLPLAALIGYTLARLWRERAAIWRQPALLGLAIVVVFVLALDNLFKVPLRQPYPGIFFFFVWGLLIARLKPIRG